MGRPRLGFGDLEIIILGIVEPVLGHWLNGCLAVAVSHGVIAVPGREVVIEGGGVDDAIDRDQSDRAKQTLVHRIVRL